MQGHTRDRRARQRQPLVFPWVVIFWGVVWLWLKWQGWI